MIKEIVVYPNKLLKEKSVEVKEFDEKLHSLLDDMFDTMIAKDGIGLAGIQIGVAKRVLIICLPREDEKQYKEDVIEIINPKIISSSGEYIGQEGCLSVPDFYDDVKRYKSIECEYFDRFGKKQLIKAEDLLSVAIQHEIDHLDGKLFIERLPMLKRKKFEKEWKQKRRKKKN
jgi:peptide deformylase